MKAIEGRLAALEAALRPQSTADPEAASKLFEKLGQMAARHKDEWIDPAHASPAQLLANPAYVRAAGVVEGADLFDAAFFGYTPYEAEIIDPQHRLFLECARDSCPAVA